MSSKKVKKSVWCYFCNKSFELEDQLISHQKMIHWRCPRCNTVKSSSKVLMQHMSKVHKEILTSIPNALPGRENPNNDVFGMKGIPEDTYIAWRSEIDPTFREMASNINIQGAFLANEATRIAARNILNAQTNIAFNQVNLFQHANVGISTNVGTIITAKGAVSSETIQKYTNLKGNQAEAAQRQYDSAMISAQNFLEDAEKKAEKKRKKEYREMKYEFNNKSHLQNEKKKLCFLFLKVI